MKDKRKSQIESNLEQLPFECYALMPTDNTPVLIRKGEPGYYPISPRITKELAMEFNQRSGVTPAQVEAMLAGSMFGWNVPAASASYWEDILSKKEKKA